MICCMSSMAAPEVVAKLSSCRTEFRPHNSTDKPGFVVNISLTPGKDITLLDTEDLEQSVTLIDSKGGKSTPNTARIYPAEDGSGKAMAELTFKKRPSGSKVKLKGSLFLSVASDVKEITPIKVNLQEPSRFMMGVFPIVLQPDKENTARSNREGGRLKRAVVRFRYPNCMKILRIARQWEADNFPTLDFAADYSQEIFFTSSPAADDPKIGVAEVHLLDVKPTLSLSISTCMESKEVEIPLNVEISLSGVTEITETK